MHRGLKDGDSLLDLPLQQAGIARAPARCDQRPGLVDRPRELQTLLTYGVRGLEISALRCAVGEPDTDAYIEGIVTTEKLGWRGVRRVRQAGAEVLLRDRVLADAIVDAAKDQTSPATEPSILQRIAGLQRAL